MLIPILRSTFVSRHRLSLFSREGTDQVILVSMPVKWMRKEGSIRL